MSCKKAEDVRFLIAKDQVGQLVKSNSAEELEAVFVQDSVVRDSSQVSFGSSFEKLQVYEKGGKHLLTLSTSADSLNTIENIRVHDPRFKSEKGIGLSSTFGEIKAAYEIKKIVTLSNNLVVFLKNSQMYFTISRAELPPSLRYLRDTDIEAVQIPDKAVAKYLMVGWDQ